jgi:hypothetical protein
MTAAQILQATRGLAPKVDRHELRAADAAATRFLSQGGSAFIGAWEAGDPDQYDAVYELVELMGDDRPDSLSALEALGAEDHASEHYTPLIRMAYYFGLALGLRLGGAR